MSLIYNLRAQAHRRFLKKEQQRQRRRMQSFNLDTAQRIGLLFNATDLDDRQMVMRYAESLKKNGKRVRLLGFFDTEQRDPNFTFLHYNKKQFDWALRPRSEDVQKFMDTPFDLLLNVEPATHLHSEYVAMLSKASIKVGPITTNTDCYDLMIDAADKKNVRAFLDQIESLLMKTNTAHEAVEI